MAYLLLIVGFALLIKGADLFVDGSSSLAKTLRIPSVIIGLTIVAIGTSLPELVTSIVAAKKGESGLALGNAVGSNVFNILFILGMSATVSPLVVLTESLWDVAILIVTCFVLLIFVKLTGKMTFKEGLVLVLIYVAFMLIYL